MVAVFAEVSTHLSGVSADKTFVENSTTFPSEDSELMSNVSIRDDVLFL